jgi:SAM-dependent methyltransferase
MYTTYSEEYYKNLHHMTPKFLEELKTTLPFFEDCRTVLEMGAGTGRAIRAFEPKVQWIGVDTSHTACQIAKDLDRPVLNRDATATRMPSDAFDAVVSYHLLEHLDDPEKAIQESVRLSRKVAVHLVPLGLRDDPTHTRDFEHITDVLNQSFGRNVHWYERARKDRKCFGVVALRA